MSSYDYENERWKTNWCRFDYDEHGYDKEVVRKYREYLEEKQKKPQEKNCDKTEK